MMRTLDPDFERRVEEFNRSQGGPSHIALAWNPYIDKWQVFAIPVQDSHHPLARNDVTASLRRPLPDDSSRDGILLFTWQDEQGVPLPLDERLFDSLRLADSFRDKHHFEKTFEEPEVRDELARNKRLRDIAYAARSYWWGLGSASNAAHSGNWRRARGVI